MKKIILAAALAALLCPWSTSAAGLEVWPTEIRQPEQTLTITNPTAEQLRFEIYADDFKANVRFSVTDFVLAPGQSKEVLVTTTRPTLTNISVVAYPDGLDQFAAAAGAKILLDVDSIDASPAQPVDWFSWGIYGGVFLGSMLLLSLMPKKR